MAAHRLALALPDGAPEGMMLVIGARGGDDLLPLDPARALILQPHFPDHRALAAREIRRACPDRACRRPPVAWRQPVDRRAKD